MSRDIAVYQHANRVGKLSLRMCALAGSGHPSSALSIAHLVTYLMLHEMRYDPADPGNLAADRLVLSEGHAVPAVYAAYALLEGRVGFADEDCRLTTEHLDALRDRDSLLDGHPNPAEGFPFFDAATGSLGMGLSVAAGLGLAARKTGSPRRVFCIIGDGESREGQIWEALDFIADHQLGNVCPIFNCNGHGQASPVSPQQLPERMADKLQAFGFAVELIDGHDAGQIAAAFSKFNANGGLLAIVARTVKGWGVEKLLKGNWHGVPLEFKDLPEAEASLDQYLARQTGGKTVDALRPAAAPSRITPPAADPTTVAWPPLPDVLKDAGLEKAWAKQQVATRRVYGAALRAAGKLLPQVCVLDADVGNSTMTNLFKDAHPERFIECKIAEQNMISVAAGMSAAGWIPFANTFAKFFARAYDQIELANITRANIKLVGSHAGITPCADGPSQMALADLAYFRSFGTVRSADRESPLLWLFQPSDAYAAYALTRLMIETTGMCYMRTHRPEAQVLYTAETAFDLRGFQVTRPGDDIVLIGSGTTVHTALAAADLLSEQKVRAAVVDCYCLPLDADKLLDFIGRCGGTALVIEDNYGAGLGSAIADAAAEHGEVCVRSLHCQRVPKSTRTPEEEFELCGVSAAQAADQALALLRGQPVGA